MCVQSWELLTSPSDAPRPVTSPCGNHQAKCYAMWSRASQRPIDGGGLPAQTGVDVVFRTRTIAIGSRAASALLCIALFPTVASAQIYSWRDANGNLVLSNKA